MAEKPGFVRNGEMKLPIGFRFHPTDEELFIHYLKRKVFCFPLPASVIPEVDVFQTHPSGLPGDSKEKRYFFGKRTGNEKTCKRACGSGYWKAIGKDKQIMSSESNQPVGLKRKMVFYQGKIPHASRTNWIMCEYRLLGSEIKPNLYKKSVMEMGDWVIYSVSQKRKPPTKGVISQSSKPNKFLNAEITTEYKSGHSDRDQLQECSSSGITEVSCDGNTDQEEISSSKNSSSPFSCTRKH